jgi:hypothetical protein
MDHNPSFGGTTFSPYSTGTPLPLLGPDDNPWTIPATSEPFVRYDDYLRVRFPDPQIARLKTENAYQARQIAERERTIAELRSQIAERDQTIGELQGQFAKIQGRYEAQIRKVKFALAYPDTADIADFWREAGGDIVSEN